MSETFNWTYSQIEKLITTKYSAEIQLAFRNAKGKSHVFNEIWVNITNRCGFTISSLKVKEKFNNLVKIYRQKRIEANKSGSEGVNWKYWDLFEKHGKIYEEIAPNNAIDSTGPISSFMEEGDYSYENFSSREISLKQIENNENFESGGKIKKVKKVNEKDEFITVLKESVVNTNVMIEKLLLDEGGDTRKKNDEMEKKLSDFEKRMKDMDYNLNKLGENVEKMLELMGDFIKK